MFDEYKEYKQDEKELFKYFVDNYYLNHIFERPDNPDTWIKCQDFQSIELIVRPNCNQKCDYCYITKYGDKLYPKEERITKEETVANAKLIFDWLIRKKVYVTSIQLFAGDLFYDDIIYDFYQLVYDYAKIILEELGGVDSQDGNWNLNFTIPTNPSHLLDPKHKQKIIDWYDKLRSVRVRTHVSISTDGPLVTGTREKKELSDAYYKELMTFADRIKSGFHPMVAPENVKYWVENLDWWYESLNWRANFADERVFLPAMLHVRNGNWTDENIADYIKFLDRYWELLFDKFCNKDKKKMASIIYCLSDIKDYIDVEGYNPCLIGDLYIPGLNKAGCGLQDHFHINLADLSVVPCHRTTYPQFRAGRLEVKDNKIVDFIAENVSTYLSIISMNYTMMPKCSNCEYKYFCIKGCLGAQYEETGEILLPIENVCKLEQARVDELLKLAYDSGVFQYAVENKLLYSLQHTILDAYYSNRGYKLCQ